MFHCFSLTHLTLHLFHLLLPINEIFTLPLPILCKGCWRRDYSSGLRYPWSGSNPQPAQGCHHQAWRNNITKNIPVFDMNKRQTGISVSYQKGRYQGLWYQYRSGTYLSLGINIGLGRATWTIFCFIWKDSLLKVKSRYQYQSRDQFKVSVSVSVSI